MMNQDFDLVEQRIICALNLFGRLADNKKYTTTDWTNGIKSIFNVIGDELGYRSFFSFCKNKGSRSLEEIQQDIKEILGANALGPSGGEWLYDIIWWSQDELDYAEDVPLVAESEWQRTICVQEDFQKLLLAKSKYRILIFEDDCGEIFKWGEAQIKRFKPAQAGERYLFCAWQGSELGFKYKLFVTD